MTRGGPAGWLLGALLLAALISCAGAPETVKSAPGQAGPAGGAPSGQTAGGQSGDGQPGGAAASQPAPSASPGSAAAVSAGGSAQAGVPGAASNPAAAPGGAPSAAGPGTSLSNVGGPPKPAEDRRAIETAIALGTPSSIANAFGLIAQAANLKIEDARLLAWIAAKAAIIMYGDSSFSYVPADFRAATEIPPYPLARLLAEAQAGRAADLPPELAGQALGELLPALAAFRSDSRETARRSLAALERFDALGKPSVIPSLIRGLDAERRSSWQEALASYAPALQLDRGAWPAVLGSVRAHFALKNPRSALELILSSPPEILELPAFLAPRARALYESGRFAEAAALVAEALRNDPLDSRLVLMRAHLLVRAKSYQQALPLLDAYGTVDSANRLFMLLRAQAAEGLRARDEALRWARRGLGSFPEDPEFLVTTARLLFTAPASIAGGREAAREEARELARRAFDLTDARSPAPGGLLPFEEITRKEAGLESARLLLEEAAGRYAWTQAASYLDRLITGGGGYDRGLACLVLRKSGNWAQALDLASAWYSERAGKPAPAAGFDLETEAATEAYIRALVGSKNDKAAQDLLPRLLAAPASHEHRSVLFYVQSLLQKSDDAVLSSLRSSLVENADNAEALAAMYDLYLRRKDLQKARFYLKQALVISPNDPELVRRNRELEAGGP